MNGVLKATAVAIFSACVFSWELRADVVNITEGSTSGYTMTDGNTYIVQTSVTFSNTTTGGSGMSVADNATVVIFVPTNVTLTAIGANGSGRTGGGAGVRVPTGATLVITGEGSVVANGGNASNGGDGGKGGAGSAYINSEYDLGGTGGSGGSGGAGGAGAGAGIGGSSKSEMGVCYILGSVNVSATGGSRGSYGASGSARGAALARVKRANSTGYWFCAAGGGGGGGAGGPGGAGSSIGGGGGDGGRGNDGEDGSVSASRFYYDGYNPPSYLYDYHNGDNGSSGASGSNGNENNGTLYVSTTATVNANRTKKTASSHPSAQYMIEFNPNGGELHSSQASTIATLGCTLPDCIASPTRPEYDFRGWTSSIDGGTDYYTASGDKMLGCYADASNITLFAQWTKTPIFVDVGGMPLTWNGIDDMGWHMTADDSVADGFSLRSGEVEAGLSSVAEASFVGKGSLSFAWKIEAGRSDKLLFLLDGVELDTVPAISRSTDWAIVSIDIPSGNHTIQWVYEQFSANGGTAWIDSVIWRPECVLAVTSGWGQSSPSVGEHAYLWGNNVTVTVPTTVEENRIRHICAGWIGTGSVPATGEATNAVTFVIEEPSSVTWRWVTECKIDFLVEGPISTESLAQWVVQGDVATVSWNQSAEFVHLSLSGDIDDVIMDEKARTLKIPADRARTVTLAATEVTLAGALDSNNIVWNSAGERRWSPQFADAYDGVDAVISGDALGVDSVLEASFSGAGSFSWSWKLAGSSASGIDVELDGNLVLTKSDSFNWCTEEIKVTNDGQHTISFLFWNEGIKASDRAYLDQVSFKAETLTTPVPVPYTWIEDQATSLLAAHSGDFELAALATAANGHNKVWECFVAGISPTNENSRFTAKIEMVDGAPVVKWEPDLNTNGVIRAYKVYGKETLQSGGEWQYPTNSLHRFFKVTVEMP